VFCPEPVLAALLLDCAEDVVPPESPSPPQAAMSDISPRETTAEAVLVNLICMEYLASIL
jgi:hypothetical protein